MQILINFKVSTTIVYLEVARVYPRTIAVKVRKHRCLSNYNAKQEIAHSYKHIYIYIYIYIYTYLYIYIYIYIYI